VPIGPDGVLARPALLARAVNLHHALRGREVAGRGHFVDERLDVRAHELGRMITGLASEVIVPRMAVGVLEAKASLAEVDVAGAARFHHPLQGAVDGGAADPLVFASNEVEEVVRAQVSLLAEEHVQYLLAFAGPLAASRLEITDVRECVHISWS